MLDSRIDPYTEKGDHKVHDGKCTFSKGVHLENYLTAPSWLYNADDMVHICIYPGLNNNARIFGSAAQVTGFEPAISTDVYPAAADYSDQCTSWWEDIHSWLMYTSGDVIRSWANDIVQWRCVSSSARISIENASSNLEGYWEAICHEIPRGAHFFKWNKKIKEFIPCHTWVTVLNLVDWPSHCSFRSGHIKDLAKQTWDLPVHNQDRPFHHLHSSERFRGVSNENELVLEIDQNKVNWRESVGDQIDESLHCWSIRFKAKEVCTISGLSFGEHFNVQEPYFDAINLARTTPATYTWSASAANPPTAQPALTWSNVLALAAESHLQDLMNRDYFSHDSTNGGALPVSPEGQWHYDRADYFGWGSTNGVTENIYSNTGAVATPFTVMQAWANSGDNAAPGTHSGNVIWNAAEVMGFAYGSYNDGGTTRWIYVLLTGDTNAFGVTNGPELHGMETLTSGEGEVCVLPIAKIHSVHNLELIYSMLNTKGRIREDASAQLTRPVSNNINNPAVDRKRSNNEGIHDDHYANQMPFVSPEKPIASGDPKYDTIQYEQYERQKWASNFEKGKVGESIEDIPKDLKDFTAEQVDDFENEIGRATKKLKFTISKRKGRPKDPHVYEDVRRMVADEFTI